MAEILKDELLTFGDVLLKPNYSSIKTRKDVSLQININNFKFNHPIIPANMKSIVSYKMCEEVYKEKGLIFTHRFNSIEDQLNLFKELKSSFGEDVFNYVGCSVGVKDEDKENVGLFLEAGVKIFCIDIAHGHSYGCMDMCSHIKSLDESVLLVAGNIATKEGARDLWNSGADIVKVGIGPSAICSTRLKAGAGVPQLSALEEIYKFRIFENITNKYIISDGGIRDVGDFVKALGFSEMVMSGNMFSGCEETPEEILELDGQKYKKYAGSSTHKTSNVEGVISLVHLKDKYSNLIDVYSQGIRSGFSYAGAKNLTEFQKMAKFVKISNASKEESSIHDVKVIG